MLLSTLDEKNLVVDWPDFIEDAFRHGWKEKTLRSRLREAIPDVYGPDFYKGWKVLFDLYLENRGSESGPGE